MSVGQGVGHGCGQALGCVLAIVVIVVVINIVVGGGLLVLLGIGAAAIDEPPAPPTPAPATGQMTSDVYGSGVPATVPTRAAPSSATKPTTAILPRRVAPSSVTKPATATVPKRVAPSSAIKPSTKTLSATKPDPISLKAAVVLHRRQFKIANADAFAWTKVKMRAFTGVLTAYTLEVPRIEARAIYTVDAMQFTNSNGERLNPFTHKPTQFIITATTPKGEGVCGYKWR